MNSPRAARDGLPVNSPRAARDHLPHISVVVPARDCAAVIGECLAAIGSQTYRGAVDVTVAVAPSRDGTEQAVTGNGLELPLQVVENPAGTTAAGLNIAVAASTGPDRGPSGRPVAGPARLPGEGRVHARSHRGSQRGRRAAARRRRRPAGGDRGRDGIAFRRRPRSLPPGSALRTGRHRVPRSVRPRGPGVGRRLRRVPRAQPGLRAQLAAARPGPLRVARPEPRSRLRAPFGLLRSRPPVLLVRGVEAHDAGTQSPVVFVSASSPLPR